ncbi:MAG: c-type cytochrome [Myxococcota bacterium]
MSRVILLVALFAAPALADDAADKKVARLWKAKCSACHGVDGRGQTESGRKLQVPDLSTAEWQAKTTDDFIRERVTNGFREERDGKLREMPAFKTELAPEHLDAVVALVRSLGPRK